MPPVHRNFSASHHHIPHHRRRSMYKCDCIGCNNTAGARQKSDSTYTIWVNTNRIRTDPVTNTVVWICKTCKQNYHIVDCHRPDCNKAIVARKDNPVSECTDCTLSTREMPPVFAPCPPDPTLHNIIIPSEEDMNTASVLALMKAMDGPRVTHQPTPIPSV